MHPYYLVTCKNFNINSNILTPPTQNTLPNVIDSPPTTKIQKSSIQSVDPFTKYDITCEFTQNEKGRAFGSNEIFEQFILIKERILYYDNNDLLILSCPKEVFKKFLSDFNDYEARKILDLQKINVDFKYIVSNQNSLGVEGVWFGDTNDINVEHLYLLGNRIENSSQYEELIDKGAKIKNLTIIYKYNSTNHKIMITREGGVIIYHNIEETDVLPLIIDIYNSLLKPKNF